MAPARPAIRRRPSRRPGTQAKLYVWSPGGDVTTIAQPGHVRIEVEACVALIGDTVRGLLPMGLAPADASGIPGMLWVLAAALAVWRRRSDH